MICVSGKEVKEIYLGNVPVSAVYIGERLVWRSRAYMEGAEVIVLTSDALLSTADGVTYSVETSPFIALSGSEASVMQGGSSKAAAVSVPEVIAEPYMRHIAPMLVKGPAGGISEVLSCVFSTELCGAAENGLTVHRAAGEAAPGERALSEHNGTLVETVNITDGAGGVLRPINVGGTVQRVSVIPVEADKGCTAKTGMAVHGARVLCADGETRKELCCITGQSAVSRTISESSLMSVGKLPLTAAVEVRASYAETERQSICGQSVWVLSEIRPSISPIVLPECRYQLPSAASAVRGFLGDTGRGGVAASFSGTCSASITLREQTDFDETFIYDLDMMSIEDIDTLTVKTII